MPLIWSWVRWSSILKTVDPVVRKQTRYYAWRTLYGPEMAQWPVTSMKKIQIVGHRCISPKGFKF